MTNDETPEVLQEDEDLDVVPGYRTLVQEEKRTGIKANSLLYDIRRGRIEGARYFAHLHRWLVPVGSVDAFIQSKQSWMSSRGGRSGRDRLRRARELSEGEAEQSDEEPKNP